MAVYALTSSVIWVGGYDVSADLIGTNVEGTVEDQTIDVTTFNDGGWHARIAGLKDVKLSGEGLLTYTNSNEENLYLGHTTVWPITLGPVDGNAASPAELLRGVRTTIGYPETVGDAAKTKIDIAGTGEWTRGVVLGAKTSIGSTLSGAGQQLGAATNRANAVFHVFTAATSINAIIESATNSAFLGATTRIQFTTATAVGAEWGTVAGAVTDQWWRWRIVTVTGTSSIAFSLGVR